MPAPQQRLPAPAKSAATTGRQTDTDLAGVPRPARHGIVYSRGAGANTRNSQAKRFYIFAKGGEFVFQTTCSPRGISVRHSTPVSVTRIVSLISIPQPSIHMPSIT